MVVAILFSVYLFDDSLSVESYLMFVLWSVLGSLLFLVLLRNDREARLGKATQVWLWLVSLITIASTIWVRQEFQIAAEHAMETINLFNTTKLRSFGVVMDFQQWQEYRDEPEHGVVFLHDAHRDADPVHGFPSHTGPGT